MPHSTAGVVVRMRDGVRLRGERLAGHRPTPVLLLHGGGQTRHAWGETSRALARSGWTAVAVDLRGHGVSDWSPSGDYRFQTLADDVRVLAAALDRPPVIVGASLGGLSALLALSADPPARAAGLVLVDVAHRFEHAGARRIFEFVERRPAGFDTPAEAAAEVADYLPHRPRPANPFGIRRNLRQRQGRWHWHWDPALLAAVRPLLEPAAAAARTRRLRAILSALELPVLLVRGAMSDVVTRAIAAEFAALAPAAEVVEVPAAAHMVAGDSNERFTAAILDFLARLERAEALADG